MAAWVRVGQRASETSSEGRAKKDTLKQKCIIILFMWIICLCNVIYNFFPCRRPMKSTPHLQITWIDV